MNTTNMDTATMLGLLADFLGILAFIMLVKNEIDTAIESVDLPPEMNFYFLFFWAFLAAFFGGLLWNALNRVNERYPFMGPSQYLGGTLSEPHRRAAVIWPTATGAPIVIILMILNWKYHFTTTRQQILLYILFLVGVTVGSVLFYDLPLAGNSGFRNYLEARKVPFFQKEFLLVVVWSSLLSILGFLPIVLVKAIVAPTPRDFGTIVWPFLKQTGLCIGLTTLAVMFFLLVFPDQPRFDTARGIIAGLFLRAALFFGLLFG